MRTLLGLLGVLVITVPTFSWTQSQKEARKQSSVDSHAAGQSNQAIESEETGNLTLSSGTEIEVEMKTVIDLKIVKPGDPFTMRTTKPVKRGAKILLGKGSLISGSVDEIASSETETRLTLLLEDVKDADTGMPSSIQAKIVSVTRIVPRQPDPEIMDVPPTAQPRSTAPASQGGGVIGGAAQAVTGVAGQVGATVDSTTRSTTGVTPGAGHSADAAARATLRVVTEPSADATAPPTSSSVLSFTGGNTRIEAGTTFLLKTTADTALAVKPTKSLN